MVSHLRTGSIDAVLFDFHGVLTGSPWSLLASVGSGGDQDAILAVLLGEYDTDGDHPWHRLERGELALVDYLDEVTSLGDAAGITIDFSRAAGAGDRIVVCDAMVEAVRRARDDGYRTAVVTNNVREFSHGWRSLVPVDELFDVVVDSSECGMRKPNPAVFHHALTLLGDVAPDRAVFLDDAPGNVAGARAAGLHGILVGDPDAALAELAAHLGRPTAH
jgi:epoxide hydrolase-like predicted phosphatase